MEPQPKNASERLQEIIGRNRGGEKVGVYAVCSAHPSVIAAAVQQAIEDDQFCTSNRHRARSISWAATPDKLRLSSLSLFTPKRSKLDFLSNECC